MRKKALLKEEREIQIVNWFAIRIEHGNEDYATMYEIAGGLGMSPSNHLALILNGMVEFDVLEKVEHEKVGRKLPNGQKSWGYKLLEGTYQRPPKQTIKLTFGRSNNRQMELL